MAIQYINTAEVSEIAKDITSLANDLNDEFNSLFKRLSNVPTTTGEWVGKQSVYYFSKMPADKKVYNNFASEIRSIGSKLSSDVLDVQTCINKNKNEES